MSSWNRIKTVVKGAQAAIESEPKTLAPLRPIVEEALKILAEAPSDEAREELKYLLTKIQEFVIPWRPSPRPEAGVLYIQPNWAKSTDTQSGEALALLATLPADMKAIPDKAHTSSGASMKVFISHSSADKAVAEAFAHLLRAAINLSAKDIRCTSVEGFKLPAGADANEQLRNEVFGSELFIALLSPVSLQSIYVMFELGARWGAKGPLAPILIRGTQPGDLKAPLSGIHAIDGTSDSDMHQLLADISSKLSVSAEGPAVYGKALRDFIAASQQQREQVILQNEQREPPAEVGNLDEIKEKILQVLVENDGLSEAGISQLLGIGAQAATFHLHELQSAHLVRSTLRVGQRVTPWHLVHEGRRYLISRGLLA